MSEQWVSTGKKFCEICKVWYGNNRASQDHHERGERHKAMLQQRIRDTMQKGKKQEADDMKLNGTLARMGAAAAASMARNGEGIVAGPSLPSTGVGLRMNIFDPSKHKDVGSMAKEMAARREQGAMKRGPGGAGAGAPDLKITKDDVVSAYRDLTNPNAAGPALPEHLAVGYMPETQVQCAEIAWVRAKNPEGPGHYYYNIFDQSTRWDAPAHFYTEQQYDQKCREFEEQRKKNYYGTDEVRSVRMGMKDVESFIKDQIAASGYAQQVEANRKELSISDKPRKRQNLTKAEKKEQWVEKKKNKEERKRRWEQEQERKKAEEEEEEEEEDVSDEEDDDDYSDEEEEEFEIVGTPEREAMQAEDDADDEMLIAPPPPAEPEPKPEPTFESMINFAIPALPTATPAAPYGSWVRITKEEKSDVPFESPLTARYREEEAEKQQAEEQQREKEPKFEFSEKTATVMTKKVKGPIEFKKKAGGRNIRKREE